MLVEIAGVTDIQLLATQQFKAKSRELAGLTPDALVNGDQKSFSFKTTVFEGTIGFAVVETTDDDVILSRSSELLLALAECKESKGLTCLFLAVVNIVLLRSQLLLCGPVETSLAEASFSSGKLLADGSGNAPSLMDLGGLVSRKKDYIPAVTKAIKMGWSIPTEGEEA